MRRPEPFRKQVICGPADFEPSSDRMKVVGAFNPGVTTIYENGEKRTLLMVRVAEMPAYEKDGMVSLPYFGVNNSVDSPFKIETDDVPVDHLKGKGKKEVVLPDGRARLRHVSYPKILKLAENGNQEMGVVYRETGIPSFYPCFEHERFGVEDFRITPNENCYFLTYVSAHRDQEVSTSVAKTQDFEDFERFPINQKPKPIFAGMKDVALFGDRLPSPHTRQDSVDDWAALVRPNAFPGISKPGIWLSYSPGTFDEEHEHHLLYWGHKHRLIKSLNGEFSGTGAPLSRVDDVWMGPFHVVEGKDEKKRYMGALFALDNNEPWRLTHRSGILTEPNDFDLEPGFVPNVDYPIGMVVGDGVTDIYSGIDDTYVGLRRYYTEDLLEFLKKGEV